MRRRAYSVLDIKAFDDDQRIIEGVASTIGTDRMGDVVEPQGAKFKLPIPLLWQHNSREPIGEVFEAKVSDKGISIKARIAKVDEPGKLQDRLTEAWQTIKHKLVRGLSIGFDALEFEPIKGTFGLRFTEWEWLELSAVTIPANADATIQTVKSFDAPHLAASGRGSARVHLSGASDSTRIRGQGSMKKTIAERKQAFVAEKEAKVARMNELMGDDEGASLDAAGQEEFDTLTYEIKTIDDHLARLETLERVNKATAKAVDGSDPDQASRSRAGDMPRVQVTAVKAEPGIGLARVVLAKAHAFLTHRDPLDVAKEWYGTRDPRVVDHFKSDVAGGTSTDSTWAGPLVDQATLSTEFVEYLRPKTIIGRLPRLQKLPFNIRVGRQTGTGTGYWVGEGKPIPVSAAAFDALTLLYTKVGGLSVITKELARFSSPSAEVKVRDSLAKDLQYRLDFDFINPAKAESAGVNPASITYGVTPLTTAGTSADNVRTDIQNLLEAYILNNYDPSGLALIMPNTLCMVLSLMVNDLGQREFPNMQIEGGNLLGLPVVGSQVAANTDTYGNMVIALSQDDIGIADDGGVDIEVSDQASLQMLDNPTTDVTTPTATSLVSLWQTNSLGIKAERFINWKKLRSTAVVFMDDVNWGAIGSPA